MPVRGGPVEKAVWPKPVASPHPRHDGVFDRGRAAHHRDVVHLVAGVVLDHAAVRRADHRHHHPAPVPQLGQHHRLVSAVVPAILGDRPCLTLIPSVAQTGGHPARIRSSEDRVGVPSVSVRCARADHIGLLREQHQQPAAVKPARAAQPAGIRQVGLGRPHIPMNLIAMHRLAAVWELERVALARDFDPADSNAHLRPEGFGARRISAARALGLVQPEIQGVGHILAADITIRGNAPIGTSDRLVSLQRTDGRADQVLDRRRDADRFLAIEQF